MMEDMEVRGRVSMQFESGLERVSDVADEGQSFIQRRQALMLSAVSSSKRESPRADGDYMYPEDDQPVNFITFAGGDIYKPQNSRRWDGCRGSVDGRVPVLLPVQPAVLYLYQVIPARTVSVPAEDPLHGEGAD